MKKIIIAIMLFCLTVTGKVYVSAQADSYLTRMVLEQAKDSANYSEMQAAYNVRTVANRIITVLLGLEAAFIIFEAGKIIYIKSDRRNEDENDE